MTRWHGRTVDAVLDTALALVIVVVGAWSAGFDSPGRAVIIALSAGAAGLSRRLPATALGLVWAAAVVQVAEGAGFGAFELAVLIVAFGTARYGGTATVWSAGLSIPAGAAIGLGFALSHPELFPEARLISTLVRDAGLGVFGAGVAAVAALAAPFAVGLLLRLNERYRRAEAHHRVEQAAADATSAAEAERTRLTREVHDVVGHSLAVIIAQADAARFAAAEADPRIRDALERIATVGRTSLAEVRDVLSRTATTGPDPALPELEDLVDGVRAAGNPVRMSTTGDPLPLDAEVAAAAYRVLQELLTNALKHSGPDRVIDVEQHWSADDLMLRVGNETAPDAVEAPAGMGLRGIESRLASVGGTLRISSNRGRFTAVVHLPVRTRVGT